MATTAQYASVPRVGSTLLTTGANSLTAPSVVGNVLIAGSSGTRIDYIDIIAVANTTSTIINLFIFDGTDHFLWEQVPVIAVTSGNTAPAFQAVVSSNGNSDIMPLTLPTGHSLRATTTQTQTGIRVTAYGGDF